MTDKLEQDALDYLCKHRIPELVSDLGAAIAFHTPDDITSFVVAQLIRRQAEGNECGMICWLLTV